jgi:hypothetical protein
MAAVTHLHNHAALTPAGDDLGERLADIAASLFSADAATKAVERAFLERLVRMLTLTPHEIHDLAVAGTLGDLMPADPPAGAVAPVRFDDVARWRG